RSPPARPTGLRHSSSTLTRARETVKFPWVWPSDSSNIPRHSNLKSKTRLPILGPILNWYTDISGKAMVASIFDNAYIETVREKMVPLVLPKAAKAVAEGDMQALDRVMTRHLAAMYKHALAGVKAQGMEIQMEVGEVGEPKLGPPAAFDPAVPLSVRMNKYAYKYFEHMRIAVLKLTPEEMEDRGVVEGLVRRTMDEWISIELWFSVPVEAKVELVKGRKVMDCDQGRFANLAKAFNHSEDAGDLEPFAEIR
ncbi:hypothetical protein BX661DRAFT_177325, partial [Kickxella alabastrina]|uniref:uncharacterized protein n=1 Tax=Kickxella alabastrina TaxID=61397 RepID=UPI0022206279